MIITSSHFTPVIHSPVGESPVAKTLTDSPNAPLKPVEPATATERARLRTPRREMDLEERKADQNAAADEKGREKAQKARLEREKLEQERLEISELATRDREVRAHEQAHMAVGGQYAGTARYQYQRGPDGVNYAVGGEVSIDVGRAATPEETIAKAQTVKRAALAPAEPSPQDLRVAAQATLLENEARKELALERAQEAREKEEAADAGNEKAESASAANGDKAESRSPAAKSGEDSPRLSSPDNANVSTSPSPAISSRLASDIADSHFTSSRVGNLLDQLA